uniref:Uncharacterized protein n=1 Tax=viral metagenome TaxID=1070528 RepID=A0A6C0J7I6_9ZZZZ
MSNDKEVCEPPPLTSDQRNPFKTSESKKTDNCPMTNFQSLIDNKDTLWHHFSKGPKHIEDCCPDGVSSSNLSKCLEDKCGFVSDQSLCRSVVEGVDFNSTQTIDEQIKEKLTGISSQNKDEIYRAVIEQLMCNNAIYSLDKINTSSKKCDKATNKLVTPEDKSLQKCIDEYEKTPDAEKLKTCVDGLTDKTSTTDDKPSTNYYQKDINWTNGINTAIALLVILIIVFMSLFNNKKIKGTTLIIISIIIGIIILGGATSINFWSSSFLENFNIIEHNDNKGVSDGINARQFWIFFAAAILFLCIWTIVTWVGGGKTINNIYIFICSVIMIVLLPKTLLSFSILNLVLYYVTRTSQLLKNISTFIIKSGVFILLYSIGKLILNMFMKQNLNKQQHSFLVTENILYIIIIGYLLSFIFSGKSILSLIKRLLSSTPSTSSSTKSLIFSIFLGGLLSLVIGALSSLGGFTSIFNSLTNGNFFKNKCMIDSKHCDINCDNKKKLKLFGFGFIPMLIILSILAVLLFRNCYSNTGLLIGLIAVTVLLTVVMTSLMIFWPSNEDNKDKNKSSSYSTIEILAIVIVIVLSLGINILSSIFNLSPSSSESKNLFSITNNTKSNTLSNFITNYIFFLLPHLDYINTKDTNTGTTSETEPISIGRKISAILKSLNPASRRSKNKNRMSGISNLFSSHLSNKISESSSEIMSAKS